MTLGCIEEVSIKPLNVKNVLAKIDTGAYSGALHCTNIRLVRRGVIRRSVLKYTPLGDPRLATETTEFQKTYIRSATGHRMRRYVIETKIEIQGTEYPIKIGLSDRSDMKKPILLGRRFLRDNDMLVDVRVNQEYDDEGERTK
jgi:hypothetical protein